MKIFLDMDGVLADFDGELEKFGIRNDHSFLHKPRSEWTEENKKLDALVVGKMREPGFFRNLPLMKDAHQLWLTAGDPYVLTARPKYREGSDYAEAVGLGERVTSEKKDWMVEYFQIRDDRFICCLRSEKPLYAKNDPGDPNILVDDLEANIFEWEKAGGVGILFRNMDQAVKDLRKAINVVSGR